MPTGGLRAEKSTVVARVVVRLASVLLAGCGATLHEPRPDHELSFHERPWRVRCEWTSAPSATAPHHHGWTWAKDPEGRRLVVDGRLRDGFFEVRAVRTASDRDERDTGTLAATAGTVTTACLATVRAIDDGTRRGLFASRAAREGEGIPSTMVFPADPATPAPVSRLVVFGDSLSDSGLLKSRLHVFPNPPYWVGRFSNGPNWTEWFSAATGIAVQNHAVGGAAATRHDEVPLEQVIARVEQEAQFFLTGSIDVQVRDHLARDRTDGVLEKPRETAYVLWAGANDYISKEPFSGAIGTMLNSPAGEAGYRRVVEEAVESLAGQVEVLHAAGARRFVVLNLPRLGRTPIVLQNESYMPLRPPPSDDARRLELARRLDELSVHHNERLASRLRRLRGQLPTATIVEVDAAAAIEDMLSGRRPGGGGRFDYGFALDSMGTELRHGSRRARVQGRCYGGGYLGSHDPSKTCSMASRAMFWDVVHPTSYTHCWVSWCVRRAMAERGWVPAPPSPEEQRSTCERAAASG